MVDWKWFTPIAFGSIVPTAILNAVGSTSFGEFQNSGGVFLLYLGLGGSVSNPLTRYQLPITLGINSMFGYVLRNTSNDFEFFVRQLDGSSFNKVIQTIGYVMSSSLQVAS